MDKDGTLNIALAFSGGGYRAASFCLGALTYLDQVNVGARSLLQMVSVLSTVSGGTITGARYAVGVQKGETVTEIYRSLYSFMSEVDLVALALERLTSREGWQDGRVRSLINAFADVYDQHLFKGTRFGVLFENKWPIHLKHISFNATEFANALQFRFQATEQIVTPGAGEEERGIVGNYYYRIPVAVASDIRMGDILAASSCFPGGFEPINFPGDFVLPETTGLQALKGMDIFPVGLMDGGIVDNQGIEPILLAEARMKRNSINMKEERQGNVLDLIIVSDVASPYMEDYRASVQKKENWWRAFTPAFLFTVNTLLLLVSGVALYFALDRHHHFFTVLFTLLFAFTVAFFLIVLLIKSLPRKFGVPQAFLKPLGKLLRLKLLVYENLVMNRVHSLLKMTNEVFLKHVRRLNYQLVFNDPSWQNRRIMNAIYELRKGEAGLRNRIASGTMSSELGPSEAVEDVVSIATSMGTTLWFTKDELEKQHMLDALIACGQFTMCWNLLEYIDKIKKNGVNINEKHKLLITCEDQILESWKKFKDKPFWLVEEYNKAVGNS